MKVKVISLLQPWATLVVLGAKTLETRPRNSHYRGKLYIHASLGKHYGMAPDRVSCKQLAQTDPFNNFIGDFDSLPFGKIIGHVNMVYSYPTEHWKQRLEEKSSIFNQHRIPKNELAFGDYSPGRYGYLFTDPTQLAVPIPAKGQLGVWEFDMPEPALDK